MSHALINLQAIPTLAFLLVVLLRARIAEVAARTRPELGLRPWMACLLIVVLTLAVFWRSLTLPLIHDSCGLIYVATQQSASDIGQLFRPPPTSPDFFFRPLAYTAFWLYAKWAGFEPLRWNAWCLCLHLANCLLLYALGRQFSFHHLAALTGALLFALHGTRAEAVAWPAVRVDLLATFFVLLALLIVNKITASASPDRPLRLVWYLLLIVTASAAFLSKEAAFALPLLAAVMLFADTRTARRLSTLIVLFATAAACFLYRYWALGGIGGYGAYEGKPAVLRFSFFRLTTGLFYRQWAFLFFPINWSERPGLALWCGLSAMAVLLLVIALVWVPASRRHLLVFLGMTVVAALPAYQLLFLGPDLAGSRVLYLPTVGLALFWAALLQGQRTSRRQVVIAAGLLFFQATALLHNLAIWREASLLAQKSYAYIAAELSTTPGDIAVENLPSTWNGVFFLRNSFPACVLVNSQGTLHALPAIQLLPDGAPLDHVTTAFRWNERSLQFDRLK